MDAPLEPWLGEHSGKTALLHPGWHQRRGPIKHRFWWYGTTSAWDAIRSTPPASPPHLSGRTQRDEEDACVGKGLTKSDQGRKALVESVYSPIYSREGRIWWKNHGCGCRFFLSNRWEPAVPERLL